MILAGDVGGTKTALGLFETHGSDLKLRREQRFVCAEHVSFEAVLEAFLAEERSTPIDAVCIGVAGIVENGRCNATNLPWVVTEEAAARIAKAPKARLLNDLEAAAHGMLFVPDEQRVVLQEGVDCGRRGHLAVLAAGTGLGEALLYWDGHRHHPMASEGGHAAFAPRNELDIELLQHLRQRHGGHVSIERVLSGPGLVALHSFLRARSGLQAPAELAQAIEREGGAAITRAALAASDPVCEQTLEHFVRVYGAEAGNLALRSLPRGGVFVGGGIAPQILPALRSGAFVDAFCDKGFFRDFLQRIPVTVVLEERAPLIGAAHYALRL